MRYPLLVTALLTLVLVAAGSGAAEAGTAGIRAAPVNLTSPTISGKAREGQTLSASQGEWSGDPTAFFYQWLRCDSSGANCVAISGASEPTYLLVAADVGSRLRVEVVAANGDGASPARRSARTAIVRVPVPVLVAKPVISGLARAGETLSASTGEWTNAPTAFTYGWRRCLPGASSCTKLPDATQPTYLLTSADVGSRMRVRVNAINAGGSSKSAGSSSTAPVKSAASGFKLGKVSKDRKRGLARIVVTVPTAGTVSVRRTAKAKGARRTVSAPRAVKLTVKPRGRTKSRLRARGKAKLKVFITYAPTGGAEVTKSRRIVLKRR